MAVVYIIDPSVGDETDSIVIKNHFGTITHLSKSLSSIVDDLFTDWAPKFPLCSPKVLRFNGMPYNRYVSTCPAILRIVSFFFILQRCTKVIYLLLCFLCSNDTGLLTLFCIMNFDGSRLVITPTNVLFNY